MSEIVTAGILVIGDEILSGRTKDKNIGFIAEYLTNIGIDLKEVRVVADEEDDIVAALNALRKRYNYVFTTGGIGPTHDDITADSVAKAFGVGIHHLGELVWWPIPGGPAERAGLEPGDRIVAVDGREVAAEGKPAVPLSDLLRGEAGTRVSIEVARVDQPLRTLTIERGSVHKPSVKWARIVDAGARIGYASIEGFQRGTVAELEAAVEKLLARGMRAFVLDLRSNTITTDNGFGLPEPMVASLHTERGRSTKSVDRLGHLDQVAAWMAERTRQAPRAGSASTTLPMVSSREAGRGRTDGTLKARLSWKFEDL